MDLQTVLSFEWSYMLPEFIILGAITLLAIWDLFAPKTFNRKNLGIVSFLAILAAIVVLLTQIIGKTPEISILFDTYRLDMFAKAFKLIILFAGAIVTLMAIEYKNNPSVLAYRGEFFYLFLVALLGAMMMVSTGDLITLFIGLETLSITSYILVGITKRQKKSNEAAFKYVINGGIASAITLFGLSYVYGLTGSTNLNTMAKYLSNITDTQQIYLLSLAFLMTFVGLSFKIAAAPFHMWAPDVYEGAPTPVTAFLAVVSKSAGFVIIVKIFLNIFYLVPVGEVGSSLLLRMQNFILVIAMLTMLIGNIIALKQVNSKRLFAYSSIAHAGYLLVPIGALSVMMLDALWVYLVAYLVMNLGIFIVIQIITTENEDISVFKGLYYQSPFLAVVLGIFIISLAGLPGTFGFIAKLQLFVSALSVEPSLIAVVIAMLIATVIAYVYYFRILASVFFERVEVPQTIKVPPILKSILILFVVIIIGLGIFPSILLDFLQEYFQQFYNFFL